MLGDIVIYQQSSAQGGRGSRRINVAGSATLIYAGEPLVVTAGTSAYITANSATTLLTVSSPFVPASVTGTGLLGIAETNSTATATAVGYVDYVPSNSATIYMCTATTPSLINTQAKYDALVGNRVLLRLGATVAGQYTVDLSDSALNGFIVQALDTFKFPNKVAFIATDAISAAL